MFGIDSGPLGWILKALKRTMAGEYGSAPYGLRRQLLNKNGKPKQLLALGERKSVADERVNEGEPDGGAVPLFFHWLCRNTAPLV